MILSTIVAVNILNVQVGKVTETKLFSVQKGKIAPGSIMLSPDLAHYSYATPDRKMIIDGKSFGPYLSNGAMVYSGNSSDYAFMALVKPGEPSKLIWNGVEKVLEFPVSNLFKAGETGGICWVERNKDLIRVVHPEGATDWYKTIEKISFCDDGSSFCMRINERPAQPTTPPVEAQPENLGKDYIVYKDGQKVPRANMMQVFPAPNNQGFAALLGTNTVMFKGKETKFKGEFYGKPLFSPDGKQFAFRVEFTSFTKSGLNIPNYQYFVNGYGIEGLQIQTGLTYSPDSKKWVMCGLNGKDPFLYFSHMGLVSYGEFPNLGGAPPEPYKVAKFADNKLILLFQQKRAKPQLFVEEKGLFELGDFTSLPETLSISPNGKTLAIGCGSTREVNAYYVDLENPGVAMPIMKEGYDLQDLGKGTFVWKNDREVQFATLKKSDLYRVTAAIGR